jgi:hypothetical protein
MSGRFFLYFIYSVVSITESKFNRVLLSEPAPQYPCNPDKAYFSLEGMGPLEAGLAGLCKTRIHRGICS